MMVLTAMKSQFVKTPSNMLYVLSHCQYWGFGQQLFQPPSQGAVMAQTKCKLRRITYLYILKIRGQNVLNTSVYNCYVPRSEFRPKMRAAAEYSTRVTTSRRTGR